MSCDEIFAQLGADFGNPHIQRVRKTGIAIIKKMIVQAQVLKVVLGIKCVLI